MLLLALALATMPRPIGTATDRDLTSSAALQTETRAAATQVELAVDTAGRPVRCDVTGSEGMRALDRAACDYLMRRARYIPARDASGALIAAVLREDFTVNRPSPGLAGPGGLAVARPVDFAVPVASLPRAAGLSQAASAFVVDVVLTTDVAGRVAACEIATSSRVGQLDRLACAQKAKTAFEPARDAAGTPVRALREVGVGFVATPAFVP